MKEQIVVGMLTLSLALGFILSIEAIAHGNRAVVSHCSSLLLNASIPCAQKNTTRSANTFCEEFRKAESRPALNETNICMVGYK